jgi:hypothetical protein
MGDRAVIGFQKNKEDIPVFLYAHWGGSDRYVDAQRAVEAARPRWDDAAYATRIGISQIIENYWAEETGFGISAGHNSFAQPDYDDVILISWDEREVYVVSSYDSQDITATFSFQQFATMLAMN